MYVCIYIYICRCICMYISYITYLYTYRCVLLWQPWHLFNSWAFWIWDVGGHATVAALELPKVLIHPQAKLGEGCPTRHIILRKTLSFWPVSSNCQWIPVTDFPIDSFQQLQQYALAITLHHTSPIQTQTVITPSHPTPGLECATVLKSPGFHTKWALS